MSRSSPPAVRTSISLSAWERAQADELARRAGVTTSKVLVACALRDDTPAETTPTAQELHRLYAAMRALLDGLATGRTAGDQVTPLECVAFLYRDRRQRKAVGVVEDT